MMQYVCIAISLVPRPLFIKVTGARKKKGQAGMVYTGRVLASAHALAIRLVIAYC